MIMYAILNPLKKGLIMVWSGTIASIPKGWTQCNGSNGSPNLQGKFVIGASADPPQGASGGSISHTHTGSPAAHGHDIPAGNDIAAGGDYNAGVGSVQGGGSTGGTSGYPPFYSLCYIMKL